MSSWADVRDVVKAAVEAALPAAVAARTPVDWGDGATRVAPQRIKLSIVAVREEHTRDQTVEDVDLTSSQAFTVQLTCESQHDTATVDGLWLLTLVTLGLRRALVRDAARADGLVLVDVPLAPRRVSSVDQNGRKLSIFVCDITFRAVIALDTDDTIGLLEHVEGSGEAEAPGGVDTVELDFAADDPTPEP